MKLTDTEIAALAEHEAFALDLPKRMEAWLSLRTEGRIDAADFAIELTIEPLKYAHPWVNYRRLGAIVEVGEHRFRVTPQQLAVFEAYERVRAAGDSVEARLRAWPGFVNALHAATSGHVRVTGHLPRVLLREVRELPPTGKTREQGKLSPLKPGSRWAMQSGHRYYLKTA